MAFAVRHNDVLPCVVVAAAVCSSYLVIWAWRRRGRTVNGTEKTDVNFYEHTIEWVDCLGLSTAQCKAICLASEAATFNWCLLVRAGGSSSSSSLVVRATVRYLPTTGRYFYPKRDCGSCCSARSYILTRALGPKQEEEGSKACIQYRNTIHKSTNSWAHANLMQQHPHRTL